MRVDRQFPIYINGMDVKTDTPEYVADDDAWYVSCTADNGALTKGESRFRVRVNADEDTTRDCFAFSQLVFTNVRPDKLRQALAIGMRILYTNGEIDREDVVFDA